MINSSSGVHSPTTELNTLDFLFLVQPYEAVLEFFLVKMISSTLHSLIINRKHGLVEILSSRKVRPIKRFLLHLVSLHR